MQNAVRPDVEVEESNQCGTLQRLGVPYLRKGLWFKVAEITRERDSQMQTKLAAIYFKMNQLAALMNSTSQDTGMSEEVRLYLLRASLKVVQYIAVYVNKCHMTIDRRNCHILLWYMLFFTQ